MERRSPDAETQPGRAGPTEDSPDVERPWPTYAERFNEFALDSLKLLSQTVSSSDLETLITDIDAIRGLWKRTINLQPSYLGTSKDAESDEWTRGVPDYMRLHFVAMALQLQVTSDTGGKHATKSAHYKGQAIDVWTGELSFERTQYFASVMRLGGVSVREEPYRPKGQETWSGEHLHVQSVAPGYPKSIILWSSPDPERGYLPWTKLGGGPSPE